MSFTKTSAKLFIIALIAGVPVFANGISNVSINVFSKDGPGDTTIVQAFTFEEQNNPETAYDSPGRRWFQFPSQDTEYQKVLMYYTLKCFEDGTAGNLGFPCGEWDYLTYTYLFEHTGFLDSNLVVHPHYMVNNQDFDSVDLTSEPVVHLHQYNQQLVVQDEVVNETFGAPGFDEMLIAGPLTYNNAQRSQYLYRANELLAAGLVSGALQKLALNFNNGSSEFRFLTIKIKSTTDQELSAFHDSGFTNEYYYDTAIAGAGWHEFLLAGGYDWDGTSNIIVEFSYSNEDIDLAPSCSGQQAEYNCAMVAASDEDRYIKFDWLDEVKIPAEAFEDITDEITVSFWLKGDEDAQPQDGTCFEGVNALNQRVLNTHIPWSNGRVYWDAGNDGGYDRIDKLAAPDEYEGKWNHYAFTKNTNTGQMRIYLNGALWHSGTGKDNTMEGVVDFSIGAATAWENYYRGSMDEFCIWNVELDENTIASWMNSDIDSSHPQWNNLMVYYKFNEADGQPAIDYSQNEHDGIVLGNPARVLYRGNEIWRNAGPDFIRPYMRFYQGEYLNSVINNTDYYEEEVPPVSVVQYDIANYAPVIVDVSYQWLPAYSYTYDENGIAIDSLPLPAQQTLVNDNLSYYQAPFEVVNRHELNRFITPYGIQLSLDDDGWRWVVDVTDWLPLLHDSVELESGNWQELLDMKFLFIEGPAARDPKRVEVIWDRNLGLSNFDQNVVPVEIPVLPGEDGFKITCRTSGHGFGSGNNCGEFCNNNHALVVNGDSLWQWNIMRDCAENPLYPQGGTWVYARAGWCPGRDTDPHEFELTPYVDGDSFTLDYDIQEDPYGNYVFFTTLFTFGEPNQQYDAEIHQILAPSDWKIHSRYNPICDNPRFILRNKGAQPLTNLTIEFGVAGGVPQTFTWSGNLGFMESEEVELTSTDDWMWSGDDEEELTFYINLISPQDENTSNNYATEKFFRPAQYTYGTGEDDNNQIIIILKTNAAWWQSSYSLYDIHGNVVFERDDFSEPNTTYKDTLQLNEGCYLFHLRDSNDDGLSFFANDDGNGSCRIDRVSGIDFINFENDFGREIKHYFHFKTDLVAVNEIPVPAAVLSVFPNPAEGVFNIKTSGFDRNAQLEIFSVDGHSVFKVPLPGSTLFEVNLKTLATGVYHVRVSDSVRIASRRVVIR